MTSSMSYWCFVVVVVLFYFILFYFNKCWQAVELWLADKVIVPIENTSGGSIHRNYDLLLRHRLHIVAEVQLATNLSLLALPGVRVEYLKRVLSHSQVRLNVAHLWLFLRCGSLELLFLCRKLIVIASNHMQCKKERDAYSSLGGAIASIQCHWYLFLYSYCHWYLQALDLSDNFLTKLGVARENVDDTAGAAQVIHLYILCDFRVFLTYF